MPIETLDRHVKNLWNKDVAYVKVLWRNNNVEELTWEVEEKRGRSSTIFLGVKVSQTSIIDIHLFATT